MPDSESPSDWVSLLSKFGVADELRDAAPYGSGHINDTFAVTVGALGDTRRYILQRINDQVFKDVPALMDNIVRVTEHIGDGMELLRAIDGLPYHRDAAGNWWRCYVFIENASTHDILETANQAQEAAFAFGQFQQRLVDLPGPRLHETIPDFHHTRRRYETFEATAASDLKDRARLAEAEIAFVRERAALTNRFLARQAQGELPERITHNDTKLNNVMLDDGSHRAVAVIDLDTVMPGLALYDFGDLVRTCTNAAAEDATDLSTVVARPEIFSALAEGYLGATGDFLTPAEIEELPYAGILITFETGLRFLTDYLAGDTYFKIHRPDHNLERARSQFALVRSLETQIDDLTEIIQGHVR